MVTKENHKEQDIPKIAEDKKSIMAEGECRQDRGRYYSSRLLRHQENDL